MATKKRDWYYTYKSKTKEQAQSRAKKMKTHAKKKGVGLLARTQKLKGGFQVKFAYK